MQQVLTRAASSSISNEYLHNTAALNALFARVPRASEQVVFPINNTALEPTSCHPAFYCIHSLSGAGATDFSRLGKLMPEVRFYGIQAPPKKMADLSFGRSVETIADYYARCLVKFQPTGPFLLGGWSAGAIIALEVARNLQSHGRDVALLVAIDAAPENTQAGYPPWHPMYLAELIGNLPIWFMNENLVRPQGLRSVARRLRTKVVGLLKTTFANGSDKTVARGHAVEGFVDLARFPEDQKSFMKRLYNALLEYTPRTYTGRVVVYEAHARPLFHLPQVGRVWSRIAPRSTIVCIKGTHLSILQKECVGALAQDLQKHVARVIQEVAV